jgi:hypothetical protein
MRNVIKGFSVFNKINEESEMEEPFRLYGMGDNPQRQLISDLKELIEVVATSNPNTQEEYEQIKEQIRLKGESLKSHPNFEEFKETGFEWQDQIIKLSDWQSELKQAVYTLHQKTSKKGLS